MIPSVNATNSTTNLPTQLNYNASQQYNLPEQPSTLQQQQMQQQQQWTSLKKYAKRAVKKSKPVAPPATGGEARDKAQAKAQAREQEIQRLLNKHQYTKCLLSLHITLLFF